MQKQLGHFLVLKDWKKVGSLFSVKKLKKKLDHFLVLKDWKNIFYKKDGKSLTFLGQSMTKKIGNL